MSKEPNVLQWEVSAAQFQVNPQFHTLRPPLYSPIATLCTDHFVLQWQLSLEQHQEEAQVFLHYRTPGIPNQGVRYSVFALQTDGSSTRLTDEVRRALATYKPGNNGKSSGGLWSLRSPFASRAVRHLEDLIWNGGTVKIRVIIAFNPSAWSPTRILDRKIQSYQLATDYQSDPGLIGTLLWSQVRQLARNDPVPANTDLVLECPNGERLAAHRAVVAAFSDPFRQIAREDGGATGGYHHILILRTFGIGPMPLFEMLHFMYLRRLSPSFHRVQLNELLEAASVFQLPDIVKWEIEKVLCIILDEQNRFKMKALADKYDLQIIQNMIERYNRDPLSSAGGNKQQSKSLNRNFICLDKGCYVTNEEKAAVVETNDDY